MAKLAIENIVRVTILSQQPGLAERNVNALAIITDEVPIPSDYGSFRTYLSPGNITQDFGSGSDTERLANIIFSQNPNIITGGGYLVVIPRDQSALAQPATILSETIIDLTKLTALDYYLNANVDGGGASDLLIGQIDLTNLASAETSLNSTAISSAGLVFSLSGELTSAKVTLKTSSIGATSSIVIGSAGTGTDISTLLAITGSATGAAAGVERVKDAIIRTFGNIDYFGIVLNEKQSDANLSELASLMQTLDCLLFVGSNLIADIAGIFKTIKDSAYTHTRCLYYSLSESDALDFAAGYASRGMSVNFNAPGTAITMNLKTIVGLVADTGINQTVADSAKTNGVDIYPDFGVAKTLTSGVNKYFDAIYYELVLKVKFQIALFNVLATTNTKIPQTEIGMSILKNSVRDICALFVTNGVAAPGIWNSPTTFGNPDDHIRNIADTGYYVYSPPISEQLQSQRAARIAPQIQVAMKSSGAVHSADVVVFIEA